MALAALAALTLGCLMAGHAGWALGLLGTFLGWLAWRTWLRSAAYFSGGAVEERGRLLHDEVTALEAASWPALGLADPSGPDVELAGAAGIAAALPPGLRGSAAWPRWPTGKGGCSGPPKTGCTAAPSSGRTKPS